MMSTQKHLREISALLNDHVLKSKLRWQWILKALFSFLVYFGPLAIILTTASVGWALVAWLVAGLGQALVGFNVMHDANHGSLPFSKRGNELISWIGSLVAANMATWRIQHNMLHHTHTNVYGKDRDLEADGLLRFHPEEKFKKMHRFQVWYATFLYGLLTLNWSLAKDFKQLVQFDKLGLLEKAGYSRSRAWFEVIAVKIMYFSIWFGLPWIFAPTGIAWSILGFVLFHFISGVVLSYVFQMAHVMEGVEQDFDEAAVRGDERFAHQLQTSANFSMKSRLVTWLVGGLNHQIEHHLFPGIYHGYLPKLAPIVRRMAADNGWPYNDLGSFADGLKGHFAKLRELSRPPVAA